MKRQLLLPGAARALIYVFLALALVVPTLGTVVVRAASAISLQSSTTANNGAGSTPLTQAKPSTTLAGDVLVAQLVVNSASTSITAPAGWQLIRSTASSSTTVLVTYFKVATASEPGSYRWTFPSAQPATGGIGDYIGVDTAGPVDATSAMVKVNTATVSFAQLTTTVANDMLLGFVGVAGNTTVTPPSGFTENYDRNDTNAAGGRTAEVLRMLDTTTGTTAVGSGTERTLAVTSVTQLVALKPAWGSLGPTPGVTSTPTATPTPVTIAVTGDMECQTSNCQGVQTNSVVSQVNPALFFPVGDLIFYGTAAEYNNYYNPAWGQFRTITRPEIGNHDGNKAYYDYWNGVGVTTGRAGTRGQGWYSISKSSWHFVVLNSNCVADYMQVSCQPGSAQINWLQSDLAAHPNRCTIVLMHYPYYTSGSRQYPELKALFQSLHNNHVDLLVAGHTHYYQRFYPQDANGNRVANGVTEIVVGTGGGALAAVQSKPTAPNEAAQIAGTYGVLKMVLSRGSYTYQFIPAPGYTATDSGSGTCH